MIAYAVTDFANPSLLEVVPWNYGFAHSWAFRALLSEPSVQESLFTTLEGLPGSPPHRVVGKIRDEAGVPGARADLMFTLGDGDGGEHPVAVETKVNDPFRPSQLTAYRQAERQPILYLPGLTGVLLDGSALTEANKIRITPEILLAAVDGSGLAWGSLLAGYLDALREEHARTLIAHAIARGETTEPLTDGRSSAKALADAAWLSAIARYLPELAPEAGIGGAVSMRATANDTGFYYQDSYQWIPENKLELWVDVVSDIRGHYRAAYIKTSGPFKAEARNLVLTATKPDEHWEKARFRSNAQQASVLKRPLVDMSAREAAEVAITAALHVRHAALASKRGI
jgi:hypothetical protein